jgi:ribosomal-protein-alanine N-acetyltransferase
MMKDIIVCPMTESDLDQVLDIETKSYPRPWSKAHFLDELSSPHSFPHVSFDCEGNVTGYICPMVLLDEGHIFNVAVRNGLRTQGIGRLLIERVIRDCRERGAAFVSLEVRTSNSPAIGLYLSLGFVVTGSRKNYYENGEDAILMEYIY